MNKFGRNNKILISFLALMVLLLAGCNFPTGSDVSIYVTDDSGNPVDAATVNAYSGWTFTNTGGNKWTNMVGTIQATVATDSKGYANMQLTPGNYAFLAVKEGYNKNGVEKQIVSGQNVLKISLKSAQSRHSQCSNSQCIQVEGPGRDSCKADADCMTTVPICGNGICEDGERDALSQYYCPNDCNITCEGLGGTLMQNPPGKTTTYSKDESQFHQSAVARFGYCTGTVQSTAQGACCINGHSEWANLAANSQTEIRLGDTYNVQTELTTSLGITNMSIEALFPVGQIQSYSCAPQGRAGRNSCLFFLEKNFAEIGLKNMRFTISDDLFDGDYLDINANVLQESEFKRLCEQRRQPVTLFEGSEDGKTKTMEIRPSGGMITEVSIGGKHYLIDPIKAAAYKKYYPNATLEELHQLTLSDELVVEMKQKPAIGVYTDKIKELVGENITPEMRDSAPYKAADNSATNLAKTAGAQITQAENMIIEKIAPSGAVVGEKYKNGFAGFSLKANAENLSGVLSILFREPSVKKVYPAKEFHADLNQSVPMINAPQVWSEFGARGEGIRIGVIDTGVDYTHLDLGGCIGQNCKVKGGYDFVNNDADPMDDFGHGTHVAGIIASDGDLKGVAPKASIYALKVLNSQGSGTTPDILAAIEWAIDPNNDGNYSDHLDVINLSLGGPGNPDDPESIMIDNAFDAGVLPVVSAGNSGSAYRTVGSPATARNALSVAAAADRTSITDFSSRGPVIAADGDTYFKPQISAPGYHICASEYDSWLSERRCIDTRHISISGTSMSAPHVSGVAALVKQTHPNWGPAEIRSAMMNNANEMPGVELLAQGSGMLDALKAAQARVALTPSQIEFGELRAQKTVVLQVKNVANAPIGLALPAIINMKKSNLKDEVTDYNFTPTAMSIGSNCLQPGETTSLSVTANPIADTGVFTGNLKIGLSQNCSGNPVSEMNAPVLISKAKRVRIDITKSPMTPEIGDENAMLILVLISPQNEIYDEFSFLTDTNEDGIPSSIYLSTYSPTDKTLLIYNSAYLSVEKNAEKIIDGVIDINMAAQDVLTIDEGASTEVSNEIKTRIANSGLESKNAKFYFLQTPSDRGGYTSFGNLLVDNTACSKITDIRAYKLNQNPGPKAFEYITLAARKGIGFYNSPEFYLFADDANFATGDNILHVLDSNIKGIMIRINDTFNETKARSSFSIMSRSVLAFDVLSFITPGDKNVMFVGRYSEGDVSLNPEVFSIYYRFQQNPVLYPLQPFPFVAYEFLSKGIGNLPAGSLLEYPKEPISNNLEVNSQQNNMIISTPKTGDNITFFELLNPRYDLETLNSKRKGFIEVRSPSGNVYNRNGISFALVCSNAGGNQNPYVIDLSPCEIGIYSITLDTGDLLNGNRQTRTFSFQWNGAIWN